MIGYIRGDILRVSETGILLDVSGVGYSLMCSKNSLEDVSMESNTALWVFTHVREDQISLFGFSTELEKQVFESLIKVNGVGPKMAIVVLSGAPLETIIDAIENSDVKTLTQLPKVGKKTAEQMILTLKGKLATEDVVSPDKQKLSSALTHLGFRPQDIQSVMEQANTEDSFEEQLRFALQKLGGAHD